jgi:THO complex subunit 4
MKYDKLGRSDGVAYVTYGSMEHAHEAIRKYNGANAAGIP